MEDVVWLFISGFATLVAGFIIMEVFRWGYNKESRGERTDIFGRPNNHLNKDKK